MDIGQRCMPPLQHAEGITVASVINGIGCPLVALNQLNIPVKKLYLHDWDDYAACVCAHHYPHADMTTLPNDAEHIQEHHITAMGPTDLMIITPPCADFCGLKKSPPDMRRGLKRQPGKLMLDAIHIVQWYLEHNPPGLFIRKNVVFNDMPDWRQVCDALGTPQVMNENVYSYTQHRLAFWSNIVVPLSCSYTRLANALSATTWAAIELQLRQTALLCACWHQASRSYHHWRTCCQQEHGQPLSCSYTRLANVLYATTWATIELQLHQKHFVLAVHRTCVALRKNAAIHPHAERPTHGIINNTDEVGQHPSTSASLLCPHTSATPAVGLHSDDTPWHHTSSPISIAGWHIMEKWRRQRQPTMITHAMH